jgi:phenylpropionate dioxygenase-like ring-hydroxylating dioxygenase large terminal subunit
MRHEEQVTQARLLLHYLATRTTAMAERAYRNPVKEYISPEQAALERDAFFRRGATMIGLSCLMPKPGDYLTHDYTGMPMLLVRQKDGSLRGFLNVCRHRGARVAEGCGAMGQGFSCPYHGWTYGADGSLLIRPDERSFAEIDRATRALREIPVAEKYGMIWASPTPGGSIDPDALLAGAERDIAAYDLDTYHHYETRVLRRQLNWKLAIDTFLETYHFPALHTKTVYPILYPNLATCDVYGPNVRMISARRTIGELRDLPEEKWDLITHTAIIYILFPNAILVSQGDHIETWHMYPAGNGIDETVMYASLYSLEPATTDSAKRHWDRNMDLLMRTVEKEDFPQSEGMQKGFYSGAQDHILFGRNEPALQHFHRSLKVALGQQEMAWAEG